MTDQPLRRFRIVVALDRSEYSEIVLEHALDQAARHDAPDLHILTVVEREADIQPAKDRLAREVVEGLDSFRREGWLTRLHVRVGNADDEISNLALDLDADLLVIGRYGIHDKRSSTADRVLAAVTCPTLIVGLAGRSVDPQPQCPRCVAVRAESDGEHWFCEEHAGDRMRLSALVPFSGSLVGGGLLW
jgi:nucleotide-binding universal stress UspA family protein